ncbi:thioredoxin family protein [Paenibacillus provencensis]|uniref:Thioredoxin family protein n=1 Tax=Paenibacillus provencensis TaxID=441151 RepID=A0ABW3Q012_9BACL|nr:thioredoxin family protein [Paenibacillus sp. MER 78]MCM3130384.1 thioredoxin family protein [Paenibacillus sp. MER 78]
MAPNLSHKFGKGLSPQEFVEGMTQNKEAFLDWYNRFEWTNEDDKSFFDSLKYRDDLRALIIAADWCGDVVRNIPVVFRALEATDMPVDMLIMEHHLEIMDQFLTMGGRSIPVVIFTDSGGAVLGTWGPRPKQVQEAMVAFKENNPDREAADYQNNLAETRKEIKRRYGEGTEYQAVIIKELHELISGF